MAITKTYLGNNGSVYRMDFAAAEADAYTPPADRTLITNAPSDNHEWQGGAWVFVTPKTIAELDQDALNQALAAPGSVVRALGLVMFAEINKLRVKSGDPAYTLAQFKTALLAQMR